MSEHTCKSTTKQVQLLTLSSADLPELRSNLVAALATLDVNLRTHSTMESSSLLVHSSRSVLLTVAAGISKKQPGPS